ncbi:MAG: YggS family pyridoxal phosphate-dependent enzyme [Ruminococcus sp.]|jgi:pyridoxal phosphate enzyme (YggS family)|nr:YggS family pyridoxal phosphate-dependent enzyme [Ruminococcus sp.]
MSLYENYKKITSEIAEAKSKYRKETDIVRLMAVTKTIPPEIVNEAISYGIDLLGENRVQEYLSKKDFYSPAEVHFIGSLQTNKVKKIIAGVTLIHSLDSKNLALEINKQQKKTDVLIELNIGEETTKSGVSIDNYNELADLISSLENLSLRGIMVIPPPGNSDLYFGKTREFFEKNKTSPSFDTLSMGMSHDYKNAVKYGSNILRVGSALFGARL